MKSRGGGLLAARPEISRVRPPPPLQGGSGTNPSCASARRLGHRLRRVDEMDLRVVRNPRQARLPLGVRGLEFAKALRLAPLPVRALTGVLGELVEELVSLDRQVLPRSGADRPLIS